MIRTLHRSFAGGEITPELYGRIDLSKFQTGLATCRNFITLPHGPASVRPGFQHVLEAKGDDVRIIPFSYNTEQTYVVEVGDQYMRFHSNGGTVLDTGVAITAITQASPGSLTVTGHGLTNGGWVYISGVTGMTQINSRWYTANVIDPNTMTLNNLHGALIDTSGWDIYTGAGTVAGVHEIVTPYLAADLFELNFVQSADVMTIVHPSYAPRELRRTATNVFALTAISFVPTIDAPTATTVVVGAGSGTDTHEYAITAVSEDALEESVASNPATGATTKTVSGIMQATLGQFTVAGHATTVDAPVYIDGVTGMVEVNDRFYRVNTVIDANTITLKTLEGVPVDTSGYTAYSGPGTLTYAYIANDLTGAGAYNTIGWEPVTGAVRYNVYKARNGLYGYIGQTAATTFNDDNIQADITITPPEPQDPFPGADDYPSATSYFEQRRCFANTNNKPQNYWLTRSGTESNMTYSIPTRDDDAITGRVVAREVNEIRHFVPLSELLLFTSGGEWRMSSVEGVLTPASLEIRPQSYVGASHVIPQVTGNSVLYVQDRGSRVRELGYSWEQSAYRSSDISIMAPHLFDGSTIVDMAYVGAPEQILWATRSDGTLLGCTYVPEHEVVSWHHHDSSDGEFESVAAVSETDQDALYAVIKREVNGRTVRYIEYMHKRAFDEPEDWFGVDSGLTYSGAATDTVTNLHHLEGMEVTVLADGKVQPPATVLYGSITLGVEASTIHVGLSYTADLETLPMSFEAQAAGQGRKKNVNKVHLRVNKSRGIFAGPDSSRLHEYPPRTTEPYDTPPTMISEEIEISLTPSWSRDGAVFIRQTDPLPLTVTSMTLEVEVGG